MVSLRQWRYTLFDCGSSAIHDGYRPTARNQCRLPSRRMLGSQKAERGFLLLPVPTTMLEVQYSAGSDESDKWLDAKGVVRVTNTGPKFLAHNMSLADSEFLLPYQGSYHKYILLARCLSSEYCLSCL